MGRMKLGIAVLLLAAAPASAHLVRLAHYAARHPAPLVLAEQAAAAYWGSEPCAGQIAVRFVPGSAAPANDTAGVSVGQMWAWTTFDTPAGPDDYSVAPAQYTNCTISIVSWLGARKVQSSAFGLFCALMVHEYGHLMGIPDSASASPDSITYPVVGRANDDIPACAGVYQVTPAYPFRVTR